MSTPVEKIPFRAIGQNILVKRLKAKATTEGGLVLPTQAQKPPQIGHVLSMGQQVPTAVQDLIDGCLVYFPEYSGTVILVEGLPPSDQYIVINVGDILGVGPLPESNG